MKKIILSLIILASLTFPLNAQWIQLTSPSSSTLNCVYFNNPTTGYISGAINGIVIKTTDGGISWIFTSTGTVSTFYDLQFIDLMTGFTVGTNKQVIKTTNGGLNWTVRTSGAGTHYSISLSSLATGYVSGGSPTVIDKSTDIGNNWSPVTPPTTNPLRGVFFINNTVGWFCGSSGTIWKTTDGGISWIPQFQSPSFNFEKIYFTTLSTGFVVGSGGFPSAGVIFKTTNGGTNWSLVYSGTNTTLYDLYYVSPNTAWAVGASGRIVKTTDDGNTWYQQNSPSSSTLYGIHMANSSTGYIVGSGGILLKTTNGGGNVILPVFQKITSGSIVNDLNSSDRCAWGDYDGDGFQDLVVSSYNDNCQSCIYPILLYHNNGDGTFTRVTNNVIATEPPSRTFGVVWGDYDNDNRLDLFICVGFNLNNMLFHNEGNGNFTKVTVGQIVNDGGWSEACAWADYDRDGWLDLFVANQNIQNDFLYHNNGNGTFTRITSGSIVSDGAYSRGCAWGDYDNDQWLDLFVVTYQGQNDMLYHNNGNGTFTRLFSGPMVNDGLWGSGCVWRDFNNDALLDLFVTNNSNNNRLYQNLGSGNFTLSSQLPSLEGGYSFGTCWSDYDNDGWSDLFVTKFFTTNYLYKNNSGSSFTKITNEIVSLEGGMSVGSCWGDYNNDGKVDLFVSNTGSSSINYLYKNIGTSGNYIICKLKDGCTSNKAGIGARIKIKDVNYSAIREVSGGSGMGSQDMLWQHFGLGSISNIDSIIVSWPSGNLQKLSNVPANQSILIDECLVGIVNNQIPVKYELLQNYPNPFNPVTTIEYSLIKPTDVKLTLFDVTGKVIKIIVNEYQSAGTFKIDFDGSFLSSGIYIYKLETKEFTDTKKMILLK